MGYTLQHGGEQREAQHYFERVLEFYVAPQDQRYTILLQLDQRVLARAMLARVLWLRITNSQFVSPFAWRSVKWHS